MASDVMSDKPAVSKKDGAPEQQSNEKLVEPDVVALENKAEKILKQTEKGKRISIELNPMELAQALRSADAVGVDLKVWVKSLISENLTTKIGQARIKGPTGATVSKVTGPSNKANWHTT